MRRVCVVALAAVVLAGCGSGNLQQSLSGTFLASESAERQTQGPGSSSAAAAQSAQRVTGPTLASTVLAALAAERVIGRPIEPADL